MTTATQTQKLTRFVVFGLNAVQALQTRQSTLDYIVEQRWTDGLLLQGAKGKVTIQVPQSPYFPVSEPETVEGEDWETIDTGPAGRFSGYKTTADILRAHAGVVLAKDLVFPVSRGEQVNDHKGREALHLWRMLCAEWGENFATLHVVGNESAEVRIAAGTRMPSTVEVLVLLGKMYAEPHWFPTLAE